MTLEADIIANQELTEFMDQYEQDDLIRALNHLSEEFPPPDA